MVKASQPEKSYMYVVERDVGGQCYCIAVMCVYPHVKHPMIQFGGTTLWLIITCTCIL